MPNDDLEERIRAASSFNDVKAIIRDYYMIETDQNEFMDYADVKRLPGESFKQLWERLVNIQRTHLCSVAGVTAQGVTSPAGGDAMNISMLN